MRPGIIPGYHSEEHRIAFESARDRWLAAGGPRRCASHRKDGNKCGGWALRGHEYCTHHVANSVQQARRLRLLSRPKTRKQAERARRREQARLQRAIWTADRWAPGGTVGLGPREDEFQIDMRALGFTPSSFSPATLDQARWAWIGATSGRRTRDELRDRVAFHVARDLAAAGL